MSLEKISGANYQSAAIAVQKPDVKATEAAINLNVADVTVTPKVTEGSQHGQDKGQNGSAVSEKQIKDAISKVNSNLKRHRTRCEFSYHEDTNRVSIKIMDEETKEVIKEIPPEEALEMVERMWELAGLFLDEKR